MSSGPPGTGRGRLTAFVTIALLAQRPAVHLMVDDDNIAALTLYRSLGFEGVGGAHRLLGTWLRGLDDARAIQNVGPASDERRDS